MTSPQPFSGSFDGLEHVFALRVYVEDTDLGGVVYHANYLRWFERARTDMLSLLGIDQLASQQAGEGAFVIAEANLRYLGPAQLNDAVVIRTRGVQIGGSTASLLQRAYIGNRCITEATIRVVFVGPNLKSKRLPIPWREAFTARIFPLTPAESAA